MSDTPLEITKKMHEMFEEKTTTQRMKMGWSMYEMSKKLIIRFILEANPNISKAELRKEIFLKFYRNDFDPITREKILKHLEGITKE